MYTLRYKLPLKVFLNNPIKKNGYETYEVYMDELNFNNISKYDIDKLDGQYDWIEAWRNREYDRKMSGFNSDMVTMECEYKNGYYWITLVSEIPFDTIIKNNRCYSHNGPYEEITLKNAIERFFEGCIWDGIGENEIGYIHYNFEELEVWMSHELTEIGDE